MRGDPRGLSVRIHMDYDKCRIHVGCQMQDAAIVIQNAAKLARDGRVFEPILDAHDIHWLRPPTGLCAGGKQTVGYMQGVVNRLRPHHPPPPTTHPPPQIDHFCITVGCWLR